MSSAYGVDETYYKYGGTEAAAGIEAKVVVMGMTGVGKTSLVVRYCEGKFQPTSTTSTTGALFVTKKVVVEGFKVRLQLWDTAGQERFRSMAPIYYRNSHAALVVYDITDANSFEDVRGWLEELKKNCTDDLIIYIVGSKADLSKRRAVTQERVRHSLRQWFPPPKAPSPVRAPSPPNSFSYIRPLFSSSASFVPFPSSPDTASPLSAGGLTRSNSTALAQPRISTPVLTRSPTSPVRSRPHQRPIARSAGSASLLSRPNLAAIPAPQDDSVIAKSVTQDGAGLRPGFGKKSSGWQDLRGDFDEAVAEEDDGSEFGLGKNIRLFEVSAKDAQGIETLFASLISAIIARRDVIEQERIKRERDSVVLNGIAPTWNGVAEEEEMLQKERQKAAASRGWGGGCC
ncbi:ras-domain-containing protein [Auriculariales sp. MPI-PUGE-AT-0066]|nr:ras-domain-containing protein [Auriculariales sp. MPI-PUGE-AT-0066]